MDFTMFCSLQFFMETFSVMVLELAEKLSLSLKLSNSCTKSWYLSVQVTNNDARNKNKIHTEIKSWFC